MQVSLRIQPLTQPTTSFGGKGLGKKPSLYSLRKKIMNAQLPITAMEADSKLKDKIHRFRLSGDDIEPPCLAVILQDQDQQLIGKGEIRIFNETNAGIFYPAGNRILKELSQRLRSSKELFIRIGDTKLLSVTAFKQCVAGTHFHFQIVKDNVGTLSA